MDYLLWAVMVLISLYWAGDRVIQRDGVTEFIESVESNYHRFNRLLSESSVIDALKLSRKLYGYLAGLFFALTVPCIAFPKMLGDLIMVITPLWLGLLFLWFSVEWILEHKKIVFKLSTKSFPFISGPFLIGVFGYLTNRPLLSYIENALFIGPINFTLPFDHQVLQGLFFSGCAIVFVFGYYLLAWIFCVIPALMTVLAIFSAIKTAQFINYIAPKTSFGGFTVITFIVCTYFLTFNS
ncbi:MAG: hypothetical protein K6L81_02010 [Agarilytica sp.]